jgi:hypothetical protein
MAYSKIDIDTVHQEVLALANKEQRGYITPQEFNLFAEQAQLEIYENYFHDLRIAQLKPKNSTLIADEIEMITERLSPFIVTGSTATKNQDSSSAYEVPSAAYSIRSINFTSNSIPVEIPEVSAQELPYILGNDLTKPTATRPVHVKDNVSNLKIYPSSFSSAINIEYYKIPTVPKWAYVVVNNKALYNAALAVNFDLHTSEQNNLVMRILELAGVSIKNQSLSDIALRDRANTKAEKNS